MTALCLGLAGTFLSMATASAQRVTDEAWAPHRSTKVLYAGKAGGQREKVFAAFLRDNFDGSATLPLEELSMATAKDFDVVIVDWVSQFGCDGYPKRQGRLFSAPTTLDADFTKPFIAFSYVASNVRPQGKLDWL
jgi:hypothetical protein